MPNGDSAEWITTKQAAAVIGYIIQYICRLIMKNCVAAKKWARDWLVDKMVLLAYQADMKTLGSAKFAPWRTGARS